MTDPTAIETEIRRLLAAEDRTTVLSNALFQQGTGLFWRLAATEGDRRAVVETPLFAAAQARVRELQYRDAAALARAAAVIRAELPDADLRLGVSPPARAVS